MPSGASRSSEHWSPADVALVCTTRSHPPAASLRPREAGAERGRDLGPRRVDVDERDLDRREPGEQPGDAAADHPGADDGDAVADQRGRVPQGVDGGLDGAGEHGARGRHVVGHDGHGAGRHHVGRLVRVQAEDRAAAQLRRPLLDGADVEVAVLDRPREVPFLERRAHRGVLARRHAAPEHQRLGPAADAGPQRADHHVAAPRLGQRDRPDLPAPGRAQPERVRIVEHVLCLGFVRHRSVGLRGRLGGIPRQTSGRWRSFRGGVYGRPRADKMAPMGDDPGDREGYFGERVAATYDERSATCSTRPWSGRPSTGSRSLPATAQRSSSRSARAGSPCRSPSAACGSPASTTPRPWSLACATSPGPSGSTPCVGDMAATRVDGEFSLVYLVFNTIFNLVTQDGQVACFANAAAHLPSGGRFVIEARVPSFSGCPWDRPCCPGGPTQRDLGLRLRRRHAAAERPALPPQGRRGRDRARRRCATRGPPSST